MTDNPIQNCLSCDTPLNGLPYCGKCGQRNVHAKLDWRSLVEDLNTHILEWNLPWLHTIKELTFRPGEVSRNYVEGDRIRYVHPLKYLVYISALVTFLLSLTPDFDLLGSYLFSEQQASQVSPVAGFFLYNIAVYVLIMSPIPVFLLRIAFWNTSRNKTEIACLVFYLQGHALLIFYCCSCLLPLLLSSAGIWDSMSFNTRGFISSFIVFVIFPVYVAVAATKFFGTRWYWAYIATFVVNSIDLFAYTLFHRAIWSLLALGRFES